MGTDADIDTSDIILEEPIESEQSVGVKGQLRLVPYESLMSPSVIRFSAPAAPNNIPPPPQPMVVIPGQSLQELRPRIEPQPTLRLQAPQNPSHSSIGLHRQRLEQEHNLQMKKQIFQQQQRQQHMIKLQQQRSQQQLQQHQQQQLQQQQQQQLQQLQQQQKQQQLHQHHQQQLRQQLPIQQPQLMQQPPPMHQQQSIHQQQQQQGMQQQLMQHMYSGQPNPARPQYNYVQQQPNIQQHNNLLNGRRPNFPTAPAMIRRVAPVAAVSSTLPPIRLIPPPIPTTNITLVPTAPASQQPLPLPSYSTAPPASAAGFQRPGYQHVRLQLEPSATAPKRVLADPADAGQPPVKIIIRPQTAERREIVVVPRSNDPGLPVIQSVRGNVSSAKPNPAIQILSRYLY